MRPSCPAAAATASRSGSMPTSSRTANWCRCSAIRAGGSSWSRAIRARLRGGRGRMPGQHPQGQQVLNVKPPDAARAVAPVEGELVAAVGENRKMVIFALDKCRRWGAAAACACNATRTAACPTSRPSRRTTGCAGSARAAETSNLSHQGARRLARQPRRRRPRAPRTASSPILNSAGPRKGNGKNGNDRRGRSKPRFVTAPGAERAPRTTLDVSSPRRRWSDRTFPGWRSRSRRRTASRRDGARLR